MKRKKSGQTAGIRPELERLKRKSTRMDAIAALGEAGAAQAVGPLLRLYRRSRKKERAAICRALAQIGLPAVEPLIAKGLRSKDSAVRECAIRALGALGPEARPALKPLIQCLQDESDRVCKEAVDALGRIGDRRAVGPLIALLDHEEDGVLERVADALGNLGEVAGEEVCRAFEEESSPRARIAAARSLGQIGGACAERTLRGAFADPTVSPSLRVAFLAALGRLLGNEIVPLATAALAEEDRALRRQAVRCLQNRDVPGSTAQLMTLYDDQDKKVRAWVQDELLDRHKQLLERARAGEADVLPALLAAWRVGDKTHDGRADRVLAGLVGIGKPLVPALVALLEGSEAEIVPVLQILERMGADAAGAFHALVVLLDHPDGAVSCAAARTLGALGGERAIPVLTARLSPGIAPLKGKKGKKARARALALQEAAAEGLGRLGKVALSVGLDAARSADPVSRRGGVLLLGTIGGGRALAALDRALSDPEPMVREAAAGAMERAAASDVRRLGKLLQNEDERARAKAVKALGKLEDLGSLDLLLRAYGDTSPRVSKAVVDALAQRKGVRSYSVLIAAAAGGNVRAIQALAEHPQPEAIPALLAALDSPWTEVYGAALEGIHSYVDLFRADSDTLAALREAIPELTGLLQDDSAEIRRLALGALGVFADPATVQSVAYLLLDPRRDICLAAVRVLASIGGKEAVAALRAGVQGTNDEEVRDAIDDVLEDLEDERDDDDFEDEMDDPEDERDDDEAADALGNLGDERDDKESEDELGETTA